MADLYKSLCYCTNLRRSARIISDIYDEELGNTGISASQYYLLINLKRMENANITHWARHVGLDRSTMVRNIAPLISAELIQQAEGRGKTYVLSEKGEQVLEAAIPIWEQTQERIKAFLGAEDAAAILRIDDKLETLKDKGEET